MVGAIQHVGGDLFLVDGQSFDLQTMMMAVGMKRAELMDKQLGDQVGFMKQRNEQLQKLNDILNTVRNARPTGDGTANANSVLTEGDRAFLKSVGVNMTGGALKAGDWDNKVIETLKTGIDTFNSTSQMETIRMQSLSDKRDLAYKMLSNQIDKFQNTMAAIVQNMK